MSKDFLKPLARVDNFSTLATTENQDQYFLVDVEGGRKKLTLQEAAQHYLKAADGRSGELIWKTKKIPKKRTRAQKFAEETSKWQEESRRLMDNLPAVWDDE